MNVEAADSGTSMARKAYANRTFGKMYAYTTLDNPNTHRRVRKENVIWHNAFRAECKVIGRSDTHKYPT